MVPEVSVVLPYRDAGDTIEEALDSVLAQRGPSLQVASTRFSFAHSASWPYSCWRLTPSAVSSDCSSAARQRRFDPPPQ